MMFSALLHLYVLLLDIEGMQEEHVSVFLCV